MAVSGWLSRFLQVIAAPYRSVFVREPFIGPSENSCLLKRSCLNGFVKASSYKLSSHIGLCSLPLGASFKGPGRGLA